MTRIKWTRKIASDHLVELLLSPAGHTSWFSGYDWQLGYIVGDNRTSIKIKDANTWMSDWTLGKLVDWVYESNGIYDSETYLPVSGVGIWTDPDTGIVYLDRVTHVFNRAAALELGHRRGELCIWDLKTLEALDCFSYA